MVQLLVDHRRVVCSLAVVLKLWLDRVDDRRKSFSGVRQPAPPTVELDDKYYSLSLSIVGLGASSIRPLPEDLFLPSQGPGQSMCALILRGVCKSWTSRHLALTLGFMTSARIASSCFKRPRQILRQTSSTGMLPQVAGLFVHASRCIQRWPVHATRRRHPLHQWSSCLKSSTSRSCMDYSLCRLAAAPELS